MQDQWYVSVDWGGAAVPKGARNDWTAVALLHPTPEGLILGDLRRLPVDLSYIEQQRIVVNVAHVLLDTCPDVRIIGDATGLGRAQLHAIREISLVPVTGITLTGGKTLGGEFDDLTVPKTDVIAAAQLALETRMPDGAPMLRWSPALEHAETLAKELRGYRFKVRASGSIELGNHRGDSDFDDLVLAVALGCWWARQNPTFTWEFGDMDDWIEPDRSTIEGMRTAPSLPRLPAVQRSALADIEDWSTLTPSRGPR